MTDAGVDLLMGLRRGVADALASRPRQRRDVVRRVEASATRFVVDQGVDALEAASVFLACAEAAYREATKAEASQ